jgi:hypothetical protein
MAFFAAATNSTNETKQGRWYVPLISLSSFLDVYGWATEEIPQKFSK